MNLWECAKCSNTAVGVGGAAGLRAIGWHFVPGQLLCPAHHPMKSSLVKFHDCKEHECSMCYAMLQAEILQTVIRSTKLRDGI